MIKKNNLGHYRIVFLCIGLATALGMVLMQNQAEKAGPEIPESEASDRISSSPLQWLFVEMSVVLDETMETAEPSPLMR